MAIITFEDLQGVEQSVDLDGKFNVAFNCDCETVMQAMPDKCVDLIVADPPYGIGITGKNRKRGGGQRYMVALIVSQNRRFTHHLMTIHPQGQKCFRNFSELGKS